MYCLDTALHNQNASHRSLVGVAMNWPTKGEVYCLDTALHNQNASHRSLVGVAMNWPARGRSVLLGYCPT